MIAHSAGSCSRGPVRRQMYGMQTGKLSEIVDEFRGVLSGRSNLLDSILPPVIFLILNTLVGFEIAAWGSLILASGITLLRLFKRQSIRYAAGGIGAVALALLLAGLIGRSEGFFLPNILSNAVTMMLALLSILAGKPLVAWTSYFARRWPLEWYWQPLVRPAYMEVTWFWAVYFTARLALQLALFNLEATDALAFLNVLTAWPATIVLLVTSYLYGTWRLRQLGGPGVEEFRSGAEPPWKGQQRGF